MSTEVVAYDKLYIDFLFSRKIVHYVLVDNSRDIYQVREPIRILNRR